MLLLLVVLLLRLSWIRIPTINNIRSRIIMILGKAIIVIRSRIIINTS